MAVKALSAYATVTVQALTLTDTLTIAAQKYVMGGTKRFALADNTNSRNYVYSGGAGGLAVNNQADSATILTLSDAGNLATNGTITAGNGLTVSANGITVVAGTSSFQAVTAATVTANSKYGISGVGSLPTATALEIGTNGAGSRWKFNVPTGGEHDFDVNGATAFYVTATTVGTLGSVGFTAANGLTVSANGINVVAGTSSFQAVTVNDILRVSAKYARVDSFNGAVNYAAVVGASTGDFGGTAYNAVPTGSAGVYNYGAADVASRFELYNGGFKFKTAPSGSAGAAITFTDSMQVDASATAGDTRMLLYCVDTGTLSRVKTGANGSGPGGSGRALYV